MASYRFTSHSVCAQVNRHCTRVYNCTYRLADGVIATLHHPLRPASEINLRIPDDDPLFDEALNAYEERTRFDASLSKYSCSQSCAAPYFPATRPEHFNAPSAAAVRAVNSLLKSSARIRPDKPEFHFPAVDSDGCQIVTDGALLYRFNPGFHFPLPERPASVKELPLVPLEGLFPRRLETLCRLPLPLVSDLRESIKEQRTRKIKVPTWRLAEGAPVVNAKYLLDLLFVFPTMNTLYWDSSRLSNILYGLCESGDALLCPIVTSDEEIKRHRQRMDALSELCLCETVSLEAFSAFLAIAPC